MTLIESCNRDRNRVSWKKKANEGRQPAPFSLAERPAAQAQESNMDVLTQEDLKALLAGDRWPALSVYLPTTRGGSEADAILFGKLMGQAEERLCEQGLRAPEARQFLAPLERLRESAEFWKYQCDGLAVFAGQGLLRIFRLPWPFTAQFDVDNHFRVLPLLPLLEADGRFFVLAVSRNSVRLFQGTRTNVTPIDLQGLPRNLAEALLAHDTDEPLNFHCRPSGGSGSWRAIFHGQGVGIDDAKDELLLYFQRLDRGLRGILHEEHAPLILAAVEYQVPLFRQACSYGHLHDRAIVGNPDRLTEAELHDRAWPLVEAKFQKLALSALDGFEQSARRQRASADAGQVISAAIGGQVETLFVAADRWLWGRIHQESSQVLLHESREPGDTELLNRAAVGALSHRSKVYVLPAEKVPRGGIVAATFRVPLAAGAAPR
jgi:hypothetical protein